MTPRTRRLYPIPGEPHGKCSYRRSCQNKPTLYHEVPTLTRGRNLSTRTTCVCAECAEIIRKVYSNVAG